MKGMLRAEFEFEGALLNRNHLYRLDDKYWNHWMQKGIRLSNMSEEGGVIYGLLDVEFDEDIEDFYNLPLSEEDKEDMASSYLAEALAFPDRCGYLDEYDMETAKVNVYFFEVEEE